MNHNHYNELQKELWHKRLVGLGGGLVVMRRNLWEITFKVSVTKRIEYKEKKRIKRGTILFLTFHVFVVR